MSKRKDPKITKRAEPKRVLCVESANQRGNINMVVFLTNLHVSKYGNHSMTLRMRLMPRCLASIKHPITKSPPLKINAFKYKVVLLLNKYDIIS